MASRPPKTGGNTTYTAEVAAGNQKIKAAEIDGDLNEIFTNIDDNNVPLNSLSTNRLKQDGGIATGHIGILQITTALLADLAVTVGKIAALAVTTAKMAVGAATPGQVNASFDTITTVTAVGGLVICTLPALTTRGGKVLLTGGAGLTYAASGSGNIIEVTLLRGATEIQKVRFFPDTAGLPGLPIPIPSNINQPAAGTYTYTVKIERLAGSGTFTIPVEAPGTFWAIEFA